ncbi:MAG: GntR family transcriptional regulator, partial [Victivallales bacterium]|nr:GntR family transcriptional regulator [Victivallales bacterium]
MEKLRTYASAAGVRSELEVMISAMRVHGQTLMPSERQLCERLKCSRKTLRNVLQQFDKDGVTRKLARERLLSSPDAGIGHRNIILIAPTDEKTHDPTISLFHQELSSRNDLTLHVIDSMSSPEKVVQRVSQLADEGVNIAFVVANSIKLAKLEKLSDRITFFRLRADDLMRDSSMPAVITDYHYGAYIGIRHLLNN